MTNKLHKAFRYGSLILALMVLGLGYSFFIEPHRLVVNSIEIPIAGFDPAFDGLKIVAISDIHGGSNGADEEKIRSVVRLANEQAADLVVLLGDYVAEDALHGGFKMPMREVAEHLAGLEARDGVLAVLGNHDARLSDEIVAAELSRVGFRVLRNQIATIERNGKKLRILGMNDHLQLNSWFTFDSDIRTAVQKDRGSGDIIVLEHSPDILFILNYHKTLGSDFKLMLAGHTHGGQVWLPIIGAPIVPSFVGQKYAAGHVTDGAKDMFVTTGVGTSILPFRFLVPPEIAVITVRAN